MAEEQQEMIYAVTAGMGDRLIGVFADLEAAKKMAFEQNVGLLGSGAEVNGWVPNHPEIPTQLFYPKAPEDWRREREARGERASRS